MNRNRFFRGGIIFSALSLALIIAGAYYAFGSYPEVVKGAALRSDGITQTLIENFVEVSAYVSFFTMLIAAVYSLASIILITIFFEKTQSPEILFFGFFVMSFSFEFARIIIPMKAVFPLPSMYVTGAARLLLFGRFMGLFSIFAASVYAAGLNAQKQQNVFVMLVMVAIMIALNIPVDSLAWDTTLKMLNGYNLMLNTAEAGIVAVTLLTFFISAYTRGSRSYALVGLGVIMVLAGRNMLLSSDTWVTPVPALVLLSAGTWFSCSRLHREYLWL